VISSITGASAVCVVTEPTVAGVHDLERVVELARRCRVPATVLVNKSDLNPANTERIESFCREGGVSYAGRIPYSLQVTSAMLAQRTLADEPRPDVFPYVVAAWDHVQAFMRASIHT
jgi:MinD superfamily P-loop ATPase